MKQLLLILLSLCVVLLVSCGPGIPETTPETAPDITEEEPGEAEEEESEGLAEAVTDFMVDEMTCTYDVPEGTGTFYLKNNMIRVEIMDNTRNLEFHYLIDDEFMYIWQLGDPNSAIKWSVEFLQEQAYEEGGRMDAAQIDIFGLNEVDEREDYLTQYNAQCTSSAPNSKFVPPGYDFMDMSALMAQYS